MRTFGITIHGTVTAPNEEEARCVLAELVPCRLGERMTFDGSELTEQHCVDCWCLVDEDDQRCADCCAGRTEVAS